MSINKSSIYGNRGEKMFDNLNAEIGRKRLKKKDIAAVLGISTSALHLKMVGKKRFYLDEACKIAKLLNNTSIEYLFQNEVS